MRTKSGDRLAAAAKLVSTRGPKRNQRVQRDKQLHACKPCVAPSRKAPAGKREDRSMATWQPVSM